MTDNIARLREAWEKTTTGEWHTCLGSGEHLMTAIAADLPDNKTALVADCLPEYAMDDGWCVEDHRPNMNFIALAHNEFGKILAVLEAAQVLETAVIDHRAYRFSGPPDAHEKVADQIHLDARRESERLLIAALSTLKGGTE